MISFTFFQLLLGENPVDKVVKMVSNMELFHKWYMDEDMTDQRLPHKVDGSPEVSIATLEKLGVLYYKVVFSPYFKFLLYVMIFSKCKETELADRNRIERSG